MQRLIALLLWVFFFSTPSAFAAELGSELNFALGRRLGPEHPDTTLTFEPRFTLTFPSTSRASLSTTLERPTDPHENFRVPKTPLVWEMPLEYLRVIATLNAVELDRWRVDGIMVRQSAAMEWAPELATNLKLPLRAGPFVQWNEYRQRANGQGIPRFGFFQRAGLEYEWRGILLEARVSVEQRYTEAWKNDYSTLERVSFRIAKGFLAGVSHELLGSVIDESTGMSKAISVFDSRESKVSVVAQWAW